MPVHTVVGLQSIKACMPMHTVVGLQSIKACMLVHTVVCKVSRHVCDALQEAKAGKSRPVRLHRETLPPQIETDIQNKTEISPAHTGDESS